MLHKTLYSTFPGASVAARQHAGLKFNSTDKSPGEQNARTG